MSDKDMQEFKREQEDATEALKLMMQKGDAIAWPEARPFYVQRFNGWMKDGEPHDLIKMLDRLQGQIDTERDRNVPKQLDTRKLEDALTSEFSRLKPDQEENAWELSDFAIEAVRFLKPYMITNLLTEKEAVEAAAKAIDKVAEPQIDAFDDKIRGLYIANSDECAKAALRAAGVRFKEEPNAE